MAGACSTSPGNSGDWQATMRGSCSHRFSSAMLPHDLAGGSTAPDRLAQIAASVREAVRLRSATASRSVRRSCPSQPRCSVQSIVVCASDDLHSVCAAASAIRHHRVVRVTRTGLVHSSRQLSHIHGPVGAPLEPIQPGSSNLVSAPN
jgi:hypothetical protein